MERLNLEPTDNDRLLLLTTPAYTTHRQDRTSLLWQIAEYTDQIRRNNNGTVTVMELIETPYDEFGLLNKQLLIQRVLGVVAGAYHWEGSFAGPHHFMWPREAYHYPAVAKNKASVINHFRECPSNKIWIHRQPHDVLHRLTPEPEMPDYDVMEQYNLEQDQVSRLYGLVRYDSLKELHLGLEEKELRRHQLMIDRLERYEDGYLGLMPSRELLASVPIAQARQILRHKAQPLGISADKDCEKVFYGDQT